MRLALSALLVCVTGCTVTPDPVSDGAASPNVSKPNSAAKASTRNQARSLLSPRPVLSRPARRASRDEQRTGLNWAALSRCESGGDPRAVDPSGTYFGLYQFDLTTWAAVGGHGNPADASPAEQTYRAELLYARAGSSPWPTCGYLLYRDGAS